jgi:hypothetical protein
VSKYDIRMKYKNEKGELVEEVATAKDIINYYSWCVGNDNFSFDVRLYYLELYIKVKIGLMKEKYCEH